MKKHKHKTTVKKKRQSITLTNGCLLLFLITLNIYLAIMLPLRFCVFDFSWHWFVFGLAALIIFFSFIYLDFGLQEKSNISAEQKKNAAIVTVKYILYFWLIDCFYMTIFNQWLLWTYIIGIAILIKVYYSLTIAFLRKSDKNAVLDFSLIFDFLFGLGLTVYLIYLMPNTLTNLQTIVTAIVAAIYGGLLTLVGVAWTIRHSDKQKHSDELIKAKPLFTFNIITEIDSLANKRKVCLVGADEKFSSIEEIKKSVSKCTESYAELENSNSSSFTIKKFYFDGKWYNATANSMVLPNAKILIQILRKNLVEHPIMEIEDIYSRKFYYDMMFVPYVQMQESSIVKMTLSELKEITYIEVAERVDATIKSCEQGAGK